MGIAGQVFIQDGANLDAFSRVRVSNPVTLFDCQHQYDKQPLHWNETTATGATITHLPNESSVSMAVTTSSGSKAVRQTKRYFRYQPGKSQLILTSFIMAAAASNLRQRVGYFDSDNGIFLEQTGTTINIARRTYTGGSAVDTTVAQASWNYDKLDGTGRSGKTLDLTKAHIFFIDLEWLGVGRVRCGFVIDGVVCYAHEFKNANSLTTVYMTTANLPVRYEIEAIGSTTAGALKQVCSTVVCEGGFEDTRGLSFAAGNGITGIGVTTRRPICSIRPKTTFNSVTNRSEIAMISMEIAAATNNAYWELVVNGTLTGASFADVDTTNSATLVDVAATAISGGRVVGSGFVTASATAKSTSAQNLSTQLILTNDIAGTTTDILTLVVTSFTGTSTCNGTLSWKETR